MDAEDDDDFLNQIAQFMAQLGDEDIDSMENYLMQMENAHASGDAANLAQLGANMDENLMAVADYLVQLDD